MDQIIVAGIGTDVGKTVVSAILTKLLQGTYWKPIDCGTNDTKTVKTWGIPTLPPVYAFKTACSPHYAAILEGKEIAPFAPPDRSPLIIELAGGVLTPLTLSLSNLDHFSTWNKKWILVSRHYLGSINHTLLTIEALQKRKVDLLGIVFNGAEDLCSEKPIPLPCLGRVLPELLIDNTTIQKYAVQWKHLSGALLRK
jgi:dethiobiotin synthetase